MNKDVLVTRLTARKSISYIILSLLLCCLLFFTYMYFSGDVYIRQVQNTCPTDYQNITIKEAFENFYSMPKWELEKDGRNNIVVFTGRCLYDHQSATIILRYRIMPDETCMLIGGFIDGVEEECEKMISFEKVPFNEY